MLKNTLGKLEDLSQFNVRLKCIKHLELLLEQWSIMIFKLPLYLKFENYCQAQVQVQVRWSSGEAQEGQEGQIPGPELYPIFGF